MQPPLVAEPGSVQISGPTHPLIPAIHTPEDRKCMMVHFFADGDSEVYAVAFYPHNGKFFWARLENFEADHDWMKPTTWVTKPRADDDFGDWQPSSYGQGWWSHQHPDGGWWTHPNKICEAQDGTAD